MTRLVLSSLRAIGVAAAALCAASVLFPPAIAATKPKPAAKSGAKEEPAKPSLVASFGDWNVFVGEVGKGRICYTLAQPKSREPASLTRDPGYAFISDRPSEGVRNEVSFIMGFDISTGTETADSKADVKPGAKAASKSDAKAKTPVAPSPVALVDQASFEMLPKGGNLWVKNAAKESALIAVMRKGTKLVIKAASLRGHQSIDTYSLTGFAQAMDRLQKECPGK
jgi:hypothetical protein